MSLLPVAPFFLHPSNFSSANTPRIRWLMAPHFFLLSGAPSPTRLLSTAHFRFANCSHLSASETRWLQSHRFAILITMNTKFLAVISVIALATICVVQGQSPSPAESPAASPSPAEKAASPSPAESPAASPKEKATPKKAKPTPTARPAARPSPAARAIDEAANPPAPGGGHGQVWVNPETGVYHRTGSRFYGTTRKGKYMTEQDAIQAGYKPAPTRR